MDADVIALPQLSKGLVLRILIAVLLGAFFTAALNHRRVECSARAARACEAIGYNRDMSTIPGPVVVLDGRHRWSA